ncbi:phage portal protein [Sporosarcina saromensis]|uniref:Phage portal protein n=1 Tax=Sporosarcina saromensis TaxID=359365 RepID=A0ABU4G5H2_9BACL|nr:phage portal protein [Sporosarcina saromensis]MDW0112214.1 phage portal protein [Sporosarcina saromensis]
MGLRDWFWSFARGPDNTVMLDACSSELFVEVFYKKLAIDSSVNLIANALVKSRFRTLEKGKIKKGNIHYLFNVKPNKNQNASEFIHEMTSNLLYDNEVLVVMLDDELYIADDWERKEFAIKENIYSKVTIRNLTLERSFNESEVFYFRLNNENILEVINGLYASYAKLLTAGMNSYKRKNSKKYFAKLGSLFSQQDEDQDDLSEMFSEQFKKFFNAEGDALWPMQEGIELEEAGERSEKDKTDSRDIRAIIDDIFDFVAMAFHIPKGLLKGDVADVSDMTDNFLTFCVNPIAELIGDEINSKMYTKDEYLEGTRLKVDTSLIKAIDITTMANAVDKFLSSGTHNPDENRDMLGLEPLNEEWSKEYYITKNYESSNQTARGGENE